MGQNTRAQRGSSGDDHAPSNVGDHSCTTDWPEDTGSSGSWRAQTELFWFLLLGLLCLVLYYPSLRINYFADDYQWFFDPPPSSSLYYFTHQNPHIGNAYRPLQAAFFILVQRRFGLHTLPIHLANIFFHVALVWLVMIWMTTEGFSRAQSFLSACLMAVSQANAMAVLSNDTFSQVLSTFTGCLGLALLQKFLSAGGGIYDGIRVLIDKHYLLGLFAFVLSLLSKETGVSFTVMALYLIVHIQRKNTRFEAAQLIRVMVVILPYLMVLALYLGMRALLRIQGVGFGSARYGFNIGLNVLWNFAMFLFQAFLPASSVEGFVAFRSGDTGMFALMFLGWLLMAAATAWGLWRSESRCQVVSLLFLGLIGLFPVVFLNKISELYLYNSMPFFSALSGIGMGKVVEASSRTLKRTSAMLLIGMCLAAHIIAVRSKTSMMERNGVRSTRLLDCIKSHIDEIPKQGELLLLTSHSPRPEYSVFLMDGFNVLNTGLHRIRELSGRTDFNVRIIGQTELFLDVGRQDVLILSCDDEANCFRHR